MTANPHPHADPDCRAVSELLGRVGDKWTVLIVKALVEKARRFNELKREVGGISQQMLTRTLRTLERDGMVARTVHPTVPPAVEYALTDLGRSLAVPVLALADWTFAHLPQIHAHRAAYDAAESQAA
ncbi:helix-turn-helix transcriptional regulator [Tsuneonella sp. YG55]|uniref:Helix-turn-helix transcriptional regulator n=1 Tax=Tsuneonella litorea TaxID=2976475 RepID=A0A9X2W2Z8_9SPHN|nr:helix-turn-helix domain-containing protein [Tsuneonella litorea]MCT2559807.1 helix-turn-helix transcriptional regulator [Tsuneonella litorea]